jgi:SAM-dependent methyltransferase
MTEATDLAGEHLGRVRAFYEKAPPEPPWSGRCYREMLAHYLNRMIPIDGSVLEVGCGSGLLLKLVRAKTKVGIDLSEAQVRAARTRVPEGRFFVQTGEFLELAETFDTIVVSDTLNFAADVQALLARLHSVSTARTRLVLNFPSNLWRPLYSVARALRLKSRQFQSNWLAPNDVSNLLNLADWELVQHRTILLLPIKFFGLERLVNRWIAPLVPIFCVTHLCVARPRRPAAARAPSVSVIIPARNESGNIREAIRRTPDFGGAAEIIFVEGHSTDDTWEEIQRAARDNPQRRISALRQTGRGKGDAVRAGFAAASGDILMILDADLTMPPEELPKFYRAIASGHAEFANGVRLVYPMEERAMRFLNLCANKFFALVFSWLLGQPVKDTLCGTKVLLRESYEEIAANRAYFGEFDPFGDFDLLFGAARLNLKIADVPIRYRERTYGTTNIQRWRHGWLLLRMVTFAARKLKFV